MSPADAAGESLKGSLHGSLYEQPAYLRAAAAQFGAAVEHVESAGTRLSVLVGPDGVRRTVPGLARPYGENVPCGLAELASDLTEPGVRLAATLSPLHPGPELARQLSVRGGRLVGERQICLVELGREADDGGPVAAARRSVAQAARLGASAEVGGLAGWFAPFQRLAVALEPMPSFDDAYFTAIAGLDHYVVAVHDAGGLAAAALFLHDGREAYLHLAARRPDPVPTAAVLGLVFAAGVDEARRTGCRVAVLGGGRSDRLNDPLLRCKRRHASRSLPRFTVEVGLAPA